ncbi:MAG: chemotaxis protein CheC [Nitrospirota bacterium]|nr:chemotaxis protein CheC [Nitrospirota bacterium]
MNGPTLYSEEQLDYLKEVMNIGAGNASTALSQLMGRDVVIEMPRILEVSIAEAHSLFGGAEEPVVCAGMDLVGDVAGTLFFLAQDEEKNKIEAYVGKYLNGAMKKEARESAFEEVANIIAGVFLTAVHDYTGLHVYHTVPVVVRDAVEALFEEPISTVFTAAPKAVIAEIEFVSLPDGMRALLSMIPTPAALEKILGSMKGVRQGYGMGE